MTLKQWLLLQQMFAQSSETVDAQYTETVEDTQETTGDTSTVTEGNELFTQEQVNKFVAKRVKEVKNQFKDYDTLKETVTKLTEQVESFKTEKKQLEQKYQETTFTNALSEAARELNLEPKLAAKLLDKTKIIFNEGLPINIKELLQVEIEENPQIVKKQVVTPSVPQSQTEQRKFSLHRTPNSNNFFSGGGLRLNNGKQES